MDTKLDKSNTIRLDVYELKDYKPVLTYRINVFDKIILSVDNNDVPTKGATKCVDETIKEYLEITKLTPIENLDLGSQLTHKFQIKKLGWKNMYLNLTDNDLIKLEFIEPKINDIKSINKLRLTKTQTVSAIVFLAALTTLLLNLNGISKMFRSWRNDTNQNQSITPKEISQPTKSHHDKILSKSDSVNISKTAP